jgi:hypothetical protein
MGSSEELSKLMGRLKEEYGLGGRPDEVYRERGGVVIDFVWSKPEVIEP